MADYEFEADIYTEGIFNAEMASVGATDYEILANKPMINGNILVGDKTSEELGIITEDDVANLVEGYGYATVSALEAEATARENADDALSDRIDNLALTGSAEGTSVQITDAANNCGLFSLYVSGNSSQNGTPTPDAPVEINSIGDSGSLSVTACGKNLFDNSLLIQKRDDGRYTEMTADGRIHFVNSAGGYFRVAASVEIPAGEYVFFRAIETISGLEYIGINDGSGNTYKDKEFTLTEKGIVTVILTTSNQTTVGEYYVNIVIVKKGSSTTYEPYKANTATITTALPLCSVGSVKDELIFNADGTAKVIKRTKAIVADGVQKQGIFMSVSATTGRMQFRLGIDSSLHTESNNVGMCVCSHLPFGTEMSGSYSHILISNDGGNVYPRCYIETSIVGSTNEELNSWLAEQNTAGTPFTVIAQLKTPQEISLTADETATLLALETFEGLTNVFNSDNAQMLVRYWRNEDVGSLLTSISRNTNQRLVALENAILGG